MTPKEADEAARRTLPIVHEGIEYKRIIGAGYWYDEMGNRSPFVQLLDKNCYNSVVYADPARCSLKNE